MFEVAEGGFLDIDVKVYNPVNKIMYDQQRETSGKVKMSHLYESYQYILGYVCAWNWWQSTSMLQQQNLNSHT